MPCPRCLLLLAPACTEEPAPTDDEGGQISLELETGATALCSDGSEEIRLAARRVNCWDPELPCTVPQDPPWVDLDAAAQIEVGLDLGNACQP